MRALVITGSRADRNGLEVVHEALLKAGHHESQLSQWGGRPTVNTPDVAIVGGDRIEILEAALWLARHRIPIAHIAGGDVTEGSADDRYRDAITALACIHCATNDDAYNRLSRKLIKAKDSLYLTGSPAIDRIRNTPVLEPGETFECIGAHMGNPNVLVCVHPNTVGDDPLADCRCVVAALKALDSESATIIGIGANADPGGLECNAMLAPVCNVFTKHVQPQIYYSLMMQSDVMVGNSSAMLYEAPSFGLQCVLVGNRQNGRTIPLNVRAVSSIDPQQVSAAIDMALTRYDCTVENPYGDGKSAPRIVKALEENAWRWAK